MSHLDPDRYEVIPVGITRDGVWTVGESDYSTLAADGRDLPEVALRDELSLSLNQRSETHNTTTGTLHAQVDVFLPVLHVTADLTVQ